MSLRTIYDAAPPALQHVLASAYGVRELRRRYTGGFRAAVGQLERQQWWSTDELAHDQDQRVRRMVQLCAERVPHYRALFRSLGIDPGDLRTAADLALLPPLDKEAVRAEPEAFLATPRPGRLVAQTTGGTTGTPLRYWATLGAVQWNYATYEARGRRWAGVRFGDRLATFQGQPVVAPEERRGPFWRRNLAFNQLYFSVYHLTPANLDAYVEALARFRPRVVAGYVSAVHRVARHLLDRGDVGRVRPRAVLVSSETFTASARHDVETAFGCRAFDAYSLGELVAFVSEGPCGEMHVSTEYGVVEVADDGEILATGLINDGMPLLRYRTGDRAAGPLGRGTCDRGLPVIEGITGRMDDVVRTPEGAEVGPAAMSLAFQSVPRLRRAQVVQSRVNAASIRCEVAEGFGPADLELLRAALRLRLGPSIELELEVVDQLPRTSGGKERLVVSTVGR